MVAYCSCAMRRQGTGRRLEVRSSPTKSPQEAALREAREEAGVAVGLASIRGVVGGPAFRMTYPNGDQVAYVSTVFDGYVLDGTPRPDDDETSAVGWFSETELEGLDLSSFTRSLLGAMNILPVEPGVDGRSLR